MLERFHRIERLGDVLAEIQIVVDHYDLALAVDDVGRARREARMRRPGDIISLLRFRGRGGDREGAAAFLDREFLERRQVIGRHANNLSAGLFEVGDAVAEGVRFSRAAAGESASLFE